MTIPDVEILLPVHNEAASIERTLREIHAELSPRLTIRFIVCEDGSRDHTREILRSLARQLPMRLVLSEARKGYARAVRDGMHLLEAPYLLCLDSDGQCDPRDFERFWRERAACDVALGWRVRRADPLARRVMSRIFHGLYQLVFHVPVHDPSCPFVLAARPAVERLLDELGAMEQGFWWEFVARAHRRGYRIRELPVRHRPRAAGRTQVYRWHKMPGIFLRHVAALFRIWWETRK